MKPRMTLDDVLLDMRSRGMPMHKKTLSDLLKSGAFPFAILASVGKTGRANFIILRSQYEAWAEENIGGRLD